MALADLDALPAGYSNGGWNPDGSLKWASYSATPAPPPFLVPGPYGGTPTPGPMPTVSLASIYPQQSVVGRQPTNSTTQPMFSTPRSGAVQGGITAAWTTRDANQKQANQSLTDFTKEFLANRGKVNQYGQEEQNAVSSVYGSGPGSLQQSLADIRRQRAALTNQAAQSAMNRATRVNSLRRLSAPNSGYLDRLFAQDLAGIAVDSAGRESDQARADTLYLNDQRLGGIGRRTGIVDTLASRNFMPAEAAARLEGANLSSLGGLANLEYGNNIYERPEDAAMRRLQYLRSLGFNI